MRPLLEDRGCITESVHILVPVDGMQQKMCFRSPVQKMFRDRTETTFHRSGPGLGPGPVLALEDDLCDMNLVDCRFFKDLWAAKNSTMQPV